MRLEDLRSFSRVVVVSGDEAYVRTALGDAEDVREALIARGVLVVPVIRGDGAIEAPSAEDRKFRCSPLRANDWLEWVAEQKKMSKVSDDQGVYVGIANGRSSALVGHRARAVQSIRGGVTAGRFVGRRARRLRRASRRR